ncbi:hypothetical protein MO973_33600 [Paenibacillus sp. TRM 82003]|nr:hypothetical protein [Paenibacillus sp. TRM 82003]
MIVLLPIGLILGLVGFILGAVAAARAARGRHGAEQGETLGGSEADEHAGTRRGVPGLVLSGISFLIAIIWAGTVVGLLLADPTLL